MLERAEELKQWVRETPLNNRLDDARRRIGKMCSEGRPPRMTIPVQYDDDDFYISTTLADAQATIADLQGQVKEAQECLSLCEHELGSVRIDRAVLQQRVAQLEGDVEEQKRNYLNACETIYKMYVAATGREGVAPKRGVVEDLADLQADHARVLGLVRALPVAERKVRVKAEGIFRARLAAKMVGVGDEMALSGTPELIKLIADLLKYRASLPAQPAQGGAVSKPVTTCNRHSDCDAADEKARAKGALNADHCHDDCCSECFGN